MCILTKTKAKQIPTREGGRVKGSYQTEKEHSRGEEKKSLSSINILNFVEIKEI